MKPRAYLVTLHQNDSKGTFSTVRVLAYDAADAITQVELRHRGEVPGSRVYAIEPDRETP
jgi:hypothetical protein